MDGDGQCCASLLVKSKIVEKPSQIKIYYGGYWGLATDEHGQTQIEHTINICVHQCSSAANNLSDQVVEYVTGHVR